MVWIRKNASGAIPTPELTTDLDLSELRLDPGEDLEDDGLGHAQAPTRHLSAQLGRYGVPHWGTRGRPSQKSGLRF